MRTEKKRYVLTLEADARPHDAEGTMRLKRLLKALLRVYALRAIEVTEVRTEPTLDAASKAGVLKQEARS